MKKKDFSFSRLSRTITGLILLVTAFCLSQTGCDQESGSNNVTGKNPVAKKITKGKRLVPVLSGIVPSELSLPYPADSSVNNRPYADQFSWQTFIALCWPVISGQRGVPLNPGDPH
ncbi:MAG: hypothetical protein JWP34_5187, partial [Massilia sp.]|nr:hypothetical protein [Massilia sp.]